MQKLSQTRNKAFPNKMNSHDRISNLPEVVLHNILSLMPMKPAIRTSILSRRWRYLWRSRSIYTLISDSAEELVCSRSAEEFVDGVNRYINLNQGKEVDTLQFFFYPGDQYALDYERWIKFAIEGGVRELDLDFCHRYLPFILIWGRPMEDRKPFKLPSNLFSCDSLTHLNLSRCDLNLPSNFNGFRSLKVLHLQWVNINDDMLQSVLSKCSMLEKLSLIECDDVTSINISAPDLHLNSLTVSNCYAGDLKIFAPNLQSLHFNADVNDYWFDNISSLVDAIVTAVGTNAYDFNYNRIKILSEIHHVKILTVCSMVLLHIVAAVAGEIEPEQETDLPITFHCLQELQMLMESANEFYLSALDTFFTHCIFPCLEKLFIELERHGDITSDEHVEMPMAGYVFDHLKMIKINNFCGCKDDLQLVEFFLEKAVVLESLVLVAPKESIKNNIDDDSTSQLETTEVPVRILREQLPLLSKASPNAQIVLYEYSEDDRSFHPTHTEVYYWMY
ncbi:F-box/FBD/LRR-repeat protein At1g13570-like isoform X1 [Magnolia sinica]|uniref:F-box/FBD/LRR-repeat protein At1g13570-like isoform X1 n=1 Tax=Magnolia sinica TaxID=86752 RepID=UPI0026584629|nr:F-box/FBD/LRR-repeat protein At1g13570-like isoform X1 [Magnolia sinica]